MKRKELGLGGGQMLWGMGGSCQIFSFVSFGFWTNEAYNFIRNENKLYTKTKKENYFSLTLRKSKK